jgi:hypothetical protein
MNIKINLTHSITIATTFIEIPYNSMKVQSIINAFLYIHIFIYYLIIYINIIVIRLWLI